MEEKPDQSDAKHDIDPWRVGIALAPLVAVAALAGGLNVEADAEHQSTVEVLRAASWVATAVALVWLCVVAMMGGGPRTKVGLELRMFVERNTRMPYVANAYSGASGAVTLMIAFAMVR